VTKSGVEFGSSPGCRRESECWSQLNLLGKWPGRSDKRADHPRARVTAPSPSQEPSLGEEAVRSMKWYSQRETQYYFTVYMSIPKCPRSPDRYLFSRVPLVDVAWSGLLGSFNFPLGCLAALAAHTRLPAMWDSATVPKISYLYCGSQKPTVNGYLHRGEIMEIGGPSTRRADIGDPFPKYL
jgi:hypothetical protein